MKPLFCLICLALCLPASAEVTIVGPDRLAVREAALLNVEGITAQQFASCTLAVFPAENQPQIVALQTLDNRPVLFVTGGTPGRFALILDVNVPKQYALVIHELEIGFPPDPPIPPVPTPTPEPGEGLTVVIVEESSLTTPAQEAVLTGPWRAWCRENGYRVRRIEKDSTAVDAQPFIKNASDLPYVFFVSDSGDRYESCPLPSAADMLTRCKKWGAKK